MVPSIVSGKQWLTSWCGVYILTELPFYFKATARLTTNYSAPPIPKSGWMNAIFKDDICKKIKY
jgi:hypothetical protein